MNNNIKIIISALIVVAIVSLLFFAIPITGAFITSYIFALIAIGGVAGTLCIYGKGKSKAIAGLSYIYLAIVYAIISIAFSLIACLVPLSVIWTLIIHFALLGAFSIRVILSNAGSDYINKVDEAAEKKHSEFKKKKSDYWE